MEKLTVKVLISELQERGFVYSNIIEKVRIVMDENKVYWDFETELREMEYEYIRLDVIKLLRESAQ